MWCGHVGCTARVAATIGGHISPGVTSPQGSHLHRLAAVVRAPPVRVAQHLVRGAHLLEALARRAPPLLVRHLLRRSPGGGWGWGEGVWGKAGCVCVAGAKRGMEGGHPGQQGRRAGCRRRLPATWPLLPPLLPACLPACPRARTWRQQASTPLRMPPTFWPTKSAAFGRAPCSCHARLPACRGASAARLGGRLA